MLKTEMRNEKTTHIDKMEIQDMVEIITEENMNAVRAVAAQNGQIVKAIALVVDAFKAGGRLIYMGAGTSGRLGVVDAAECPPTYGVPKDMVIGLIAGGSRCMVSAAEGEEDDGNAGVTDLKNIDFSNKDVLVGISVAGGADYVVKAIEYAKSLGAKTIGITSNEGSKLDKVADVSICPDTGAEVVTGSTRMKAGTAQKLILNTISTCSMIKCGYVYENMMINLKPTNIKLTERIVRIVREIVGCDYDSARAALEECNWDIRKASSKLKGNEI